MPPTSLPEAIGRLLVGRLSRTELEDKASQALSSGIMGGVILFKENAVGLEQLLTLTNSIYQACSFTPILTVDQEGGAVQRFDHLLSPLPSAMAQAANKNKGVLAATTGTLVARITCLCAEQLYLLGVNLVLSPVLDVLANPVNSVIGTRSFSSDPHKVKELGQQVIESFLDYGLVPVGKHFPGHGSTTEDSHLLLAVNHKSLTELKSFELIPFAQLINKLPAILTGHIWLPALDPKPLPASLSAQITSGLLRQDLGFKGLIMTDDLSMKAITNTWGIEEAAVLALEAGADVLLICSGLNDVQSAHQAIVKAVESGRLPEKRIFDSLSRLNKIFSMHKLVAVGSINDADLADLKTEIALGKDICQEVSLNSICLLRGKLPALPSGTLHLVAPNHPRYPLKLAEELKQSMEKCGSPVQIIEHRYTLDPPTKECQSLAEACSGKVCLYLTFKPAINKGQIDLGRMLAKSAIPFLTVAVDTPFDCKDLPDWPNCLATLDPSDLAMEALAIMLAENKQPTGTLPVDLSV